jgi:outer membrane protein
MMWKQFVLAIAVSALPLVGASAQTYKFGHVYTNEIIAAMPEYKAAESELKSMAQKYDDELKRIQDEFNSKVQSLRASVESLPQPIAQRRQKELEDMATKQQAYQQQAQQTMQDAQNKRMAPILEKVNAAVKAVGESEGVIYVFDISRTPLAYIDDTQSLDLTGAVKARLGLSSTGTKK